MRNLLSMSAHRNILNSRVLVLMFCCLLLAAMQKFTESKQSGETVAEKATKTPENVESVKENVKENGDASKDSRPNPAGESHEDECDTATPNAQVNSMSSLEFSCLFKSSRNASSHRREIRVALRDGLNECQLSFVNFTKHYILCLLTDSFVFFFLSRREHEYLPWSGHVLFLPYHCCSSCLRDIILLLRQWQRPRLHVQVHCDAAQVLLFLLFQTSSWREQIFLIRERHLRDIRVLRDKCDSLVQTTWEQWRENSTVNL